MNQRQTFGSFLRLRLWPVFKFPRRTLLVFLLNFLKLTRLRKIFIFERLEIVSHYSAIPLEIQSLKLVENWISCGPQWDARSVPKLRDGVPKIGYSIFEDASVAANPRFSGVISRGKFHFRQTVNSNSLPKVVTSHPPVSGFLMERSGDLLFSAAKGLELPTGIFVGTPSPHNWYHWLIDTLSAVYLARFLPREFAEYPLLLPEEGMFKGDWLTMLYGCSGGRKIISLQKERYTQVKSLVWLDGPTARGPFGIGPDTALFSMETGAMNHFRNELLTVFPAKVANPRQERLFLARSPGSLRGYNQAELIEIARTYGFEPIFQESLPLSDSISLVRDAEYLIGPHGAGWATAIFAQKAKGALIWAWDEAAQENWFYNLLATRGIPFETLFTGPGNNSCDYVLSDRAFEESLRRMLR